MSLTVSSRLIGKFMKGCPQIIGAYSKLKGVGGELIFVYDFIIVFLFFFLVNIILYELQSK